MPENPRGQTLFVFAEKSAKKLQKPLDKARKLLYNHYCCFGGKSQYGGIAQLVEHPVHTRVVICSSQIAATRPVGQVVKTPPFHGGNMGSSPVRVTKEQSPHFLGNAGFSCICSALRASCILLQQNGITLFCIFTVHRQTKNDDGAPPILGRRAVWLMLVTWSAGTSSYCGR